MQILIMRHGDAVAGSSNDAERTLSAQGDREARLAAAELKNNNIVMQRILCSPLIRARQTAEIVRTEGFEDIPVETWGELAPGADCDRVANMIKEDLSEDLLLVCHQPFAGRMIHHLTGVETAVSTGMLACIRLDAMDSNGRISGELAWIGPNTDT